MAAKRHPGVDLIAASPGVRRRGSRPKPPKAGARSDRLEPRHRTPDNAAAERRLTSKTAAGPAGAVRPQTPRLGTSRALAPRLRFAPHGSDEVTGFAGAGLAQW